MSTQSGQTGQSPRDGGCHHTVQLVVRGDTDRAGLEELLGKRYDVVVDETLQPADCYVVGDQMVPAYRNELRAEKDEGDPAFCPVLVIQQAGSNGTVPLPSEQPGDEPPLIDDVVSAPADRSTLYRRLGNLLARREQSVDLARRYEDVQTRFQRLFESTNDAILVVGPDGDEITECNPAACDLVGHTREELLSLSPVETIHADDHERFQSFLRDIQDSGHSTTDDLTCRTKVGETRQLEVSGATLQDSERSPIILSARDVTDRKAYERELELKSRVMDEAPVGITITDPDQEDNPMVYVNDGFAEVTGYSAEESTGRNFRFLQGEETREEPVAKMREAVDATEPVSVELRNYRKDDSQFWNRVTIAPVRDDDGTVTNWVGFQEDVTERKEREQNLQQFKKAVENAGRSVFITDKEGTIEYVNPVFEAKTGYTSEEAVGRTPRILKSGKEDDECYERLWETILAGEQWDGHLINQRKNGELYHINQTISPITNSNGEITNFVAVKADVTTRRLREQQLGVLNRVLRHNLRNGMNVIQGHAERLSASLEDGELRADAAAIKDRADTLVTVGEQAKNARSLFKDRSPTETSYDVTQLLTDIVDEVSESYPAASVTLADSGSVCVWADNRLKIAVTELLENAIIHNDNAVPEVTVSAEPVKREGPVEWMEIEIADNGPGIPDNEQKTIESGEETSLQHGTGLGLWVVHWTVSLLGGELSIENNSPRGTCVVLSVPRASEKCGDERSGTRHGE